MEAVNESPLLCLDADLTFTLAHCCSRVWPVYFFSLFYTAAVFNQRLVCIWLVILGHVTKIFLLNKSLKDICCFLSTLFYNNTIVFNHTNITENMILFKIVIVFCTFFQTLFLTYFAHTAVLSILWYFHTFLHFFCLSILYIGLVILSYF